MFSAGWSGLLTASLIGLALIAGMLFAARDDMVREGWVDDETMLKKFGYID